LKTPLGIDHPIRDLDRAASGHFSSTRWQHSYDYGTVFYLPANRWQAHIDLEHHILGIELTPGIVKTRLNCASWNTDVTLSGSLYHVAANSTIEVKKEQPIDFVLVTIEPDWADHLFREAGFAGAAPPLSYNLVDPSVERLARQVRQQFLQDDKDVVSLASCLAVQAVGRLLSCSAVQRRRLRYRLAPYQVRATLDYIDENLASPLSVEVLAQVTGLSGFFFAHAFTEMLGYSPHQYILDRRLARARDMITKTKSSLAEIAYAVGFSSQSHMTSTFCKRLGVTPRVLRQSQY
jgi:AraC family transcriptional regulator